MSKLFSGGICLTDLIEAAQKGHSAFVKSKNGKVYFNMQTWLNDEPDKYGNVMTHQLFSLEEKREEEGKIYIGNSKEIKLAEPVKEGEIKMPSLDNVRVAESKDKATVTNLKVTPFHKPGIIETHYTVMDAPDDLPF